MRAPGIALDDDYTLDEDVILADPQTGLPRATWTHGAVKNKLDISYDWNTALAKDKYLRRQIWTASKSADVYGEQLGLQLALRGVKTDHGGQALMDALALGFMQRWGVAPWFLRCSTVYLRHTLEILDSVRVTHSLLANPLTGKLGLDRERFEVLEVTTQFLTEGRLDLLLLWVGGIETSAVPLSTGAFALIPGVTTVDAVDTSLSVGGSVTKTTAAAASKIRVGLKRETWRRWNCRFSNLNRLFIQVEAPDACNPVHDMWMNRSYTGSITYKIEYKTSGAPDAPGTGSDPTTGWVSLLASTIRGSVGLYAQQNCVGYESQQAVPAEEMWAHLFEAPALAATPNTYNVKVTWEAVGQQGNPCSASNFQGTCGANCSGTPVLAQSNQGEMQTMALDFIESIT